MLGQVLGGRYLIIRHLGGGGFGQTYLAQDQHLPGNPVCVVKQLKPKIRDPQALQTARRLFDREAEALYTLGCHDQIPRLYAHFEENQEFYLVQEFIEGHILSKELKRGRPFEEAEVIGLLQDILATLEFVHQQQVIHRDIKPSNLIRRRSDQKIVLIDFGSVKQINQSIELFDESLALETEETCELSSSDEDAPTTITVAIGSYGYMPNEQIAGKPRFSSDVYAVGMVGIRALTGMRPTELREDPRTGEIIWRDEANVSTALADILDTMVSYDFRQRYPSAVEAIAALNQLAAAAIEAGVLHPPTTPLSESHQVWLERADELFAQQRYQDAVSYYGKVLDACPNDYTVWFKQGMALENLHRYEAAIAAYDRVIEIQPNDYLVWFKRARALENLRQHTEAVTAYDRVIEIQPDNYWAWHDRGRVLELLERYEDAAASYDRAVNLKPKFELAIESRKRVLSQLKRVDRLYDLQHYEEAIESCNKAIRTNPDDALAWLMRGMALENAEQYEEAAASYNRVVKLQPTDHLAWFKRGGVLEKLERYKEAAIAYNQVVKLQRENCWAWHDRGRVLEKLQWYEEALVSYEKALRVQPDFPEAQAGRQRMMLHLLRSRSETTTS
ncbi:tetratricopeptide repeat protein [Microcoleus sp. FACHB-1515]|uniref:serine/threonine-protein kinase n=1 Tax=Cyanophyceae TaxID=3028117 RepID=UPI00168480B7|nr:serine/threonine-protein kinase [Microcoleus sp. FACHB-1515]MBD2092135.1 tetratricopeptide repeat protein [Microcoleus sp. FACHB-1515]